MLTSSFRISTMGVVLFINDLLKKFPSIKKVPVSSDSSVCGRKTRSWQETLFASAAAHTIELRLPTTSAVPFATQARKVRLCLTGTSSTSTAPNFHKILLLKRHRGSLPLTNRKSDPSPFSASESRQQAKIPGQNPRHHHLCSLHFTQKALHALSAIATSVRKTNLAEAGKIRV